MQRKKLCIISFVILLAIDISICIDKPKIKKSDEITDDHGTQTYVIQPSSNPEEIVDDPSSTDSPLTGIITDSKDTSISDGVSTSNLFKIKYV